MRVDITKAPPIKNKPPSRGFTEWSGSVKMQMREDAIPEKEKNNMDKVMIQA